jgi:signal transduction histidine kinase/CheY-like chemotaxis protein
LAIVNTKSNTLRFKQAESPQSVNRSSESAPDFSRNPTGIVSQEKTGVWNAEAAVGALSESVPCGVLLFEMNGELRAANSHFAEILGREKDQILALGRFENLVERLAPAFAEPEAVAARWRERRDRGEPCWDELQMVSPSPKQVQRFARPIADVPGRRVGWLEIYRDVTGQKLVERNLFQVERMVTLGQLVSSVAHDLSNPLTSIIGHAHLLQRRRESPQGGEDVERIVQEADRASRIARNLLQFGRGAKSERMALHVNEIVKSAMARRAADLALESIELQLELEPDLPPVMGDAAQLQQVLLNLVVNSAQAIRQGSGRGHIRIRTRRASSDRLALDVIDDGPGILPEILPRIFDPFFTTKPPGVGTGLGLSIAYGVAHDHDGGIAVESRPDCGTVVTLELPVSAAASAAVASVSRVGSRTVSGPPAGATGGCERILVIEDEPAVARLIADILTEDGHRAEVVLDSREALALIERRAYGLVLCDLHMPYLSGRGLFQDLVRRNHPLHRRFVFVTGDAASPDVCRFLAASGVPYLAKPFLIDELKEMVQRALKNSVPQDTVAAVRTEKWDHGARREGHER